MWENEAKPTLGFPSFSTPLEIALAISTFPQFRTGAGRRKVEIQNQDFHFPSASDSSIQSIKNKGDQSARFHPRSGSSFNWKMLGLLNLRSGIQNTPSGTAAGYAVYVPSEDKELFAAVNHGEFPINGFRNRDIQLSTALKPSRRSGALGVLRPPAGRFECCGRTILISSPFRQQSEPASIN